MKATICILALTFLAVSARAATITSACTPNSETFSGGVGLAIPTCPAFTVAGATLTGATLLETLSFSGGSGMKDVDIGFAPATVPAVIWSGDSLLLASGVTSGSASGSQSATAGVSNANFAADFGVDESSEVFGIGSVGSSSAGLQIDYTYTTTPTVPEPSAASVCGIGLCALAFIARRRWFLQR